jgi:hypothetical protein
VSITVSIAAIPTADTVLIEFINLTSLKTAAGIPVPIQPQFISFTA